MKKNKNSRIFSRVLSRLAWAAFYHVSDENENAYKEVLAAKRCIEECGGDNVKVAFYDREYHITFDMYHIGVECNRHYTVSATQGYVNADHTTNKSHVNHMIKTAELLRDYTLTCDFRDYQRFMQVAGSVLFWALEEEEYLNFYHNGCIKDIPYNVAIQLYRAIRATAYKVMDNAIEYKKVVL